MEVETGIEPVYKVLQTFASPLGHSTAGDIRLFDSTKEVLGADDETRTRDPHLGKVMRYQLRYIRILYSVDEGKTLCARYWDRTSDPYRVEVVLYR